MIITKIELDSRGCVVTPTSRSVFEVLDNNKRKCPKLGAPPVQLKRGRPPSEIRRDRTERRKVYTRSNTLRCSKCKQFGNNSRSHREGNVLDIRRERQREHKVLHINQHCYTIFISTNKIKNFFISTSKSSTFFKSATFFNYANKISNYFIWANQIPDQARLRYPFFKLIVII
ncbi:hypothetical protein Cgig2_011135 [Carnegiea gigantea]|uniref:Uncharacterized protein n=1 Tax=Carnegiea gigantea TaxID=171969 RepID=A0A9Q1H113_9CARY|nr:hypothetical protein Cgig2_011135 [Carnegiea gigantea]